MQTQNSSNSLWKLFSWNSFSASEPDLRAGLFCRCHLRMAKKNATCPRQLRCDPLRSAASLCLCRFLCRFFSFRHLAEYHKDAIGLIMLQYKEQNITDPLNTFKKYLKSILKKKNIKSVYFFEPVKWLSSCLCRFLCFCNLTSKASATMFWSSYVTTRYVNSWYHVYILYI